MENIYVNVETSSEDETSNTSGSDEELFTDVNLLNKEFMNYTQIETYEKNRNSLFTKDLETIDVLIEHTGAFTSSQKFFFSGSTPSLSYKNVIDVFACKRFCKNNRGG